MGKAVKSEKDAKFDALMTSHERGFQMTPDEQVWLLRYCAELRDYADETQSWLRTVHVVART